MIKKIALAGIFFVVSAISVSQATAVTTTKANTQTFTPAAPVPHNICPLGTRC